MPARAQRCQHEHRDASTSTSCEAELQSAANFESHDAHLRFDLVLLLFEVIDNLQLIAVILLLVIKHDAAAWIEGDQL